MVNCRNSMEKYGRVEKRNDSNLLHGTGLRTVEITAVSLFDFLASNRLVQLK